MVPQNLCFDTLACSPVEERDVFLAVTGQGVSVERVRTDKGDAQMRGERLRAKGIRRPDFGFTSPLLGEETGLIMGMGSLLLLVRSLLPLIGFPVEMGTLCMGGSHRDAGMKRAEYWHPQPVQSASMSTPSRIESGPPSSRPPIVLTDATFCDKCLHVLHNDLLIGANLACSMQSAQARMPTPLLAAQGLLVLGII